MSRRVIRCMTTSVFVFALLVAALPAFAQEHLRMSTTTSTENSGLLKVLLPPFEKKCDCRIDVIAVGTGKALKLAEAGDVDVVFVHARKLEDEFVAGGYGVNRHDVMYNDFVIIGPQNDPAKVKSASSVADALKRIADAKATFISRGDESGTHQKEKELWQTAGVTPSGDWYRSAGQGMGEVIMMATEQNAYTLADRATYAAFKQGKTNLALLYENDKTLFNPYGVIAVNPAKHPNAKIKLANQFIDFVTGPEGKALIRNFKIGGQQVFFVAGEKNK